MATTIKDIAKRTGLGLATVSSYLNGGSLREKNRMLIEQAIEELGYEVNEVARSLKTNHSKTIGIIIPELSNLFCTEIISVVEDLLRGSGYATMVCDCRTNPKLEREAVDFLLQKRVDGIINIPVDPKGDHLLPVLKKGKPVLLLDRGIEALACDSVLVDNRQAVEDAVELLIQNGHEKIGIVCGPDEVYTARERKEGYLAALKKQEIPIDVQKIADGENTIEGGSRCMGLLCDSNPDMTALIVTNYEMTVGAVIEANKRGIMLGKELSMIGFDNEVFAKAVSPQLTVITQPLEEIAKYAASQMLGRLSGEQGEPQKTILKTRLIYGKTVQNRKG